MTLQQNSPPGLIIGSLLLALLLSIAPMPSFMEIGRPLWLALVLSYWALQLPPRIGMVGAWAIGLLQDVLYGSLLGQHALMLTLIVCLVLTLQRRMQMFPQWQQSLVLLVVYGLTLLLQLWIDTLSGGRPPMLAFLLPALTSALLWPWVVAVLRGVGRQLARR